MSDIDDLFPENKQDPGPLPNLRRENAMRRLASAKCPLCSASGQFALFERAMHVGILCLACGREHPFRRFGIMWLPGTENAWRRG